MSFPITYRAIRDIFHNEALTDPMPKQIVRKGLNLLFRGEVPIAQATTIVDAYIIPETPYENYQWKVDLTGVTYLRIASRSYVEGCELWYSLEGASGGVAADDLIVTDWLPMEGRVLEIDRPFESDRQIEQEAFQPLWFEEIPEELQGPLRLTFNLGGTVSTGGPSLIPSSSIDGPFNVALQVL